MDVKLKTIGEQTVVIAGASSGIGLATGALRLWHADGEY